MRKVLVSAVMAVMVVVVGSAAACQTVTECGTVVTQDAVVTTDITGCAGDALVVGADGITLDLDGHTVESIDAVGLRLSGHSGVTIKDGTVEGATVGLALSDASGLVVSGVVASTPDDGTASDPIEVGMELERVTGSRITRSSGNGDHGFLLIDSHDNRIRRSTANGPRSESRDALHLEGSDRNRITEGVFGAAGVSDDGIEIRDSEANVIADNRASGQDGSGIHVQGSPQTVMRRNLVSSGAPATAILVSGSPGTVIADNVSSGYSEGVRVGSSDRAVVRANEVEAIEVLSSDDVVVDLNAVDGSSYPDDGISVSEDSAGVRVSANRASGFGDDGIDIDAPGTRVRDNVATDNGDLGIEAVPGIVDQGENRADGNGNPAQCTNVACTPPPA